MAPQTDFVQPDTFWGKLSNLRPKFDVKRPAIETACCPQSWKFSIFLAVQALGVDWAQVLIALNPPSALPTGTSDN